MKKLLLKTMLLLCALVAGSTSVWATEVTYDFSFTKIGSTGWSNSYADHTVSYDESTVSFNASKQTGTITDCPVTKGQPVTLVMKDGNTLNSVTFVCKKWGSKAQTITLHYSTDGGENYTSTGVTSTNFTITKSGLPTGTNAVKITFSSTSNQVGIQSATIDYSAPAPAYTITAESNDEDLGTVSIDGSTITASPKSGNRVISGAGGYTVTAGTAGVTNNGDNTFTVDPSSDCTVQINFEAIPSHSVTCVADPVAGGTVEAVAASVREGETTSITATPNAGYKFTGWSVSGTGASLSSTSTNPTTLTMGTEDATVTASFEAVTTYPIHWSVNGVVVKTDNVEENTAITFAAPASGIPAGYVFKGWVVEGNKIDTPTDTDPSANYVTSANSTAEITYYVVMAVEIDNTVQGKVTITPETENVPTNYGTANTFTEYTLDGKKFKVQQMYINNGALQWRASDHTSGAGTMYNTEALGIIKNIILTYSSGDSKKNFTLKVGDAENPTSGTSITPSIDGSVYTFDCSSLNKSYFVLANGLNAGYLASIEINYQEGEISTFNFCTAVPTATIDINSACTDGEGNYYGTYSNSSAFVVPADLTVSAISVDDSKLTKMNYDTGDIVPANTGVLVAATTSGDHTVNLAAGGTEKTGNMLKASSVAMDMAETEFFRLTMHNGTNVGFWWGAENGAAFSIEANKAYLAVPAANIAGVRGFSLTDEEADGINMVQGEGLKVQGYFDLSGRRVVKPTKGLYIVNGKKVVK